jgi:hypothetical protein
MGVGAKGSGQAVVWSKQLEWAATIKVRTNDNQDENVPVGAGRREGVARP